MQEVTPGSRVALDGVYRDAGENLVDPVTPLVDILDPTNTVIASAVVPVRSSQGLYDYPGAGYLVPSGADLGVWTARWTGTVDGDLLEALDEFEVVALLTPTISASYVTVEEVRARPGMADDGKYPDADVEAAVSWFETKFEDYVGVAFTTRTASEWVDGPGRCTLWLVHWPVIAVTDVLTYTTSTASTAFTGDELADIRPSATGQLRRVSLGSFAAGLQNLLVTYTHGFATTPLDIKDACLVAVSEKLTEDITGARGNRQFAVATQDGIVRSSVPGPDRPFGVPAVDQVAESYRRRYRVPAIA